MEVISVFEQLSLIFSFTLESDFSINLKYYLFLHTIYKFCFGMVGFAWYYEHGGSIAQGVLTRMADILSNRFRSILYFENVSWKVWKFMIIIEWDYTVYCIVIFWLDTNEVWNGGTTRKC